MKQLTGLLHLDLSVTNITALPEWIWDLTHLEYLDISGCSKLSEIPESIGNLTNLTFLAMDTTGRIDLPESLGNCTHLTHLNLNFMSISELPQWIENLPLLKYLKEEVIYPWWWDETG